MKPKVRTNIDYRPYLRWLVLTLEEGNMYMANNLDRLDAAVAAVGDKVAEVAAAIRNPAQNDQPALDALADQLEAAADALETAVADENAEDGTPAPAPEPEPTPEA